MKELDTLKDIFLTDVDPETRQENLETITQWENQLLAHEAYQSWQKHDITKEVAAQLRKTYTDASLTLANERNLPESKRLAIFAQKDAALWLLSIINRDIDSELATLQNTIRQALNATN